jgi:glycosyltransferase involved in cell wall biosynthesis
MNSKPKKVLMLVHTFPPFGTVGGSIRLVKFLRYMTKGVEGWSPTIITLSPEIDLLWLAKDSGHSLDELPKDLRIIHTNTGEPVEPKIKPGALFRFVRKLKLALFLPIRRFFLIPDDKRQWTSHLEEAALRELAKGDYSLIYATAPPHSVLLAAERIKKKSNLPLVIDIKDDWVTKYRHRGYRRFRKKIERAMEERCISAADKVITVTQPSYEDYRRKYPEQGEKFEVIHNGCDVTEYSKYWSDWPAKFEKFTLIHTGVFSHQRDMTSLFHALKRMVSERPEIADKLEYMIVGRIPNDQLSVIQSLELSNVVRAVEYMDRDLYVETLVKAHLPIVINYSVSTLIPGKLYEYWGSGNKMLLLDTSDSAAADLVTRYGIGRVIGSNDEEEIYSFLTESYEAWTRGEVERCDLSNLHLFDRSVLTEKLETVFDSALEK